MASDYACNIYGIDQVPKFEKTGSIIDYYLWTSYFFKLDADKNVSWKLPFHEETISGPYKPHHIRKYATRTLVNRQNDVYLIFQRERATDIYTPVTNREEATILKKIEYVPRVLSPAKVDEAFIIDDNLFIVGFPDDDMPSRTTMKILKTKSGKSQIFIT